jgi:hypothetical protein
MHFDMRPRNFFTVKRQSGHLRKAQHQVIWVFCVEKLRNSDIAVSRQKLVGLSGEKMPSIRAENGVFQHNRLCADLRRDCTSKKLDRNP